MVRRFKARRESKTSYMEYNSFYHWLGSNFKTCSLEIFHLLPMVSQNRSTLLWFSEKSDKIAMILFVPDACTSSVLQWWLAVSKTTEYFDIISITQNTTIGEDIMMITHVSQWWVKRL
jgi:hypothetical protein